MKEKLESIERLFYNKRIRLLHELQKSEDEDVFFLKGQIQQIDEFLNHIKETLTPPP